MDEARRKNPNRDTEVSEFRSRTQHSYKRPERRSVGSINDWQDDEVKAQAEEELIPQGKLTRKQKRQMPQLKHDISYGQYLHKPKNQRALFTSQATKYRNKQIARGVAFLVFLALIYVFVKYYY